MKEWGIAMEGCERYIVKAIIDYIIKKDLFYCGTLRYIEVGIAEGKTFSNICHLLNLVCRDWEAIAIDVENGWSLNKRMFDDSVKEFADKVRLDLRGSEEALGDIDYADIILIDGDHSYNSVIRDFNLADKILVNGGIVMFHDSDEASQGNDIQPSTGEPIMVRKALNDLGLLDGHDVSYKMLFDFAGREPGRGITIFQKL